MIKKNFLNGSYYSFNNLSKFAKLENFISTKNLLFGNVLKALGISRDDCVVCKQVHGNNVVIVDSSFRGQRVIDTDALITTTPKLCLVVKTADCVPLILYDSKKFVLGVVHAGWKGTLLGISSSAVQKMISVFGSISKDIFAAVGPSIGPGDYKVRSDVANAFMKKGYNDCLNKPSKDQWGLDLWKANEKQLLIMGIPKDQIEVSGMSTYSNNGEFYSSRRGDKNCFFTGGMIRE